MSKFIDKDELLRTLEQDIDVSVTGEENMEAVRKCLQEIMDDVRNSPEVDAVPVRHGKWLKIHPQGIYECSECHQNVMTSDIDCYKFCHQCGARMDAERKDHAK